MDLKTGKVLNMQFIQIAYCCSIPFLLLISWMAGAFKWRNYSVNLISVSNVLLLGYSLFLLRQLIGIVQLGRTLADKYHIEAFHKQTAVDGFMIRQAFIILVPFLFLSKKWRKNRWISIAMLLLLFWNNPISVWNSFDLMSKIASYGFLFCSAYALIWLLNQLPHQSNPQ